MPQPALDTHAEVRKLKQAGWPEEQAEAMVDLVSRAPLNAQIAGSLEQMQFRLKSIESTMATMATQTGLEALALRVESIESAMATMATRKDLEVLQARTDASIEGLRAEMSRMFWIQGGALATLILGLATIMLGLAL
ncbi:MAG: hypothetical protein OXH45_01870 [Gammaproteobacteria bacterium]|nr:hypothetical protein [Gammaproteobacteria bacterium]